MPTSSYVRLIAGICLAFLVIIVGLSYVLYNQGPRVRLVQFSDDPASSFRTDDSTMTLVFDRPLEQKDYTDAITIRPDIAFTAKTSTQNITIKFEENISHDTEYSVVLLPDVFDKATKKMKTSFTTTFSTSPPEFVYIERNYEQDIASDTTFFDSTSEADDHVLLARPGQEPEILFSYPEIRSFAVNSQYAAIIGKGETKDALFTLNLDTKDVREEQILFGGRLKNLSLSTHGKIALFTIQPEYSSVSPEYFDTYSSRIESLNLETGELRSLTTEAGEYIKAHEVFQDRDGQVALLQDFSQAYYAISPFNDYDPILIGSFDASFGFNNNASELVFRDFENIVRYDVATSTASIVDLNSDGFIRFLSPIDDSLLTSSTDYSSDVARSDVSLYKNWNPEPEIVWQGDLKDKSSVQGFSHSFDNNLLAIQKNPEACQFDMVGINSQCTNTHTIIYDISKQEIVDDVRGFDVVWVP